jgi:hypothetical protein
VNNPEEYIDFAKVLQEMGRAGVQPQARVIQIWKYALHPYEQIQKLTMPRGSFLLSVGTQPYEELPFYEGHPAPDPSAQYHETYSKFGQVMYLWAMVDPKEPVVRRAVVVVETGVAISNEELGLLVGAVRLSGPDGNYVAHVFDSGREEEL